MQFFAGYIVLETTAKLLYFLSRKSPVHFFSYLLWVFLLKIKLLSSSQKKQYLGGMYTRYCFLSRKSNVVLTISSFLQLRHSLAFADICTQSFYFKLKVASTEDLHCFLIAYSFFKLRIGLYWLQFLTFCGQMFPCCLQENFRRDI